MITDKETLEAINKMNYKSVYNQGVKSGEKKATKKILKELLQIIMYESFDIRNNGYLWIKYHRLSELTDKLKEMVKKK
jgi:hypothetical protein